MLSQKYTEDEINEFGDLAALTPQQIVELLNRKSSGLNGNGSQKVIPVEWFRRWSRKVGNMSTS